MQKSVKIRTRYDERTPVGVRFTVPSRVKQEFLEESDINTLVKRFLKTGQMPEPVAGRYADFTQVEDYQEVMNRIINFENEFMSLPAEMRKRFDNDPANLIEFLAKSPDEARKLGLLPAETGGHSTSLDVTVPTDTAEVKNASGASQQGPAEGGKPDSQQGA